MSSKLKVYELAKELSVDSQHLVDVIQRLGVDIKNSMSVLGTEEVRSVREYYRKQRPLAKASTPAPANTKSPVTEKRVGATVIRRRAKTEPDLPTIEKIERVERIVEEEPAPIEAEVEAPPEMEVAAPEVETTAEETPTAEAAAPEVTAEAVTESTAAPATTEAPKKPAETGVLGFAATAATVAPANPPAAAATPAAPVKPPAPKEPEKKRRLYPSILKRVATEQYLGEKVGPKPPTPVKKEESKTAPKTGAGAILTTGDGKLAVGAKRVKEIDLAVPEAAKDAKRRVIERQNSNFKSTDYLKRELVHATKKKKTVVNRPAMKTNITKPAEHKRVVEMPEVIAVSELAKEMGIKATAVISKLMGMGVQATMNQKIDFDTASLLAPEFGFEIKQKMFKEENFLPATNVAPENLKARPPVVTIMGHVDHGKTSLLDAIRKSKVAAGEAGGITQHVGAYTVMVPKGKIAFIDTPGHEAFTAMRARGAKVTDIVVLVVSATDGVMPQTLESIAHAKAAGVPIIVAVNKIDLPDANPERIKQTLAGQNLNPEEWGGDTIYVSVSAKTGKGLDQLLESILLQAEVLELKANFEAPARGTIVESSLDKFRGPVATVLIQQGTLKPGAIVVCGKAYGKVKAMTDSFGKKVTEAVPGDPVSVLGLSEVPNTGEVLGVVEDERTARSLVEGRSLILDPGAKPASRSKMTLDELLAENPTGDRELRVILKADVQGSTEALKEAMSKIPQQKVSLRILHTGTGGITESDVMLASASEAVVLGFNIRPDVKSQKLADVEGVSIKTYTIIYDLLQDLTKLLEGLLEIGSRDKVIGRAEVRNVFHIPKIGAIAGSAVIDGKVTRGCFLRLLRDSRVVYEGKISSLKRFKEDVKEVASGFECGIGLDGFNDVKLGDQFEAYVKEEVKGTL